MRPIDADALIEKCGDWYVEEGTESGFIGTLKNLLATEPTIQPQSTTGQLNDGAQSTAQSTNLIDRQAAIDELGYCQTYLFDSRDKDKKISLEDAEYAIEQLPSAQPEPNEGEWVPVHPLQSDDSGAYMCSKCKTGMWEIRPSSYHYCPNCGAKMGGKPNE